MLDFWRFPHLQTCLLLPEIKDKDISQVNFKLGRVFYQAQDVEELEDKAGLSAWWSVLAFSISHVLRLFSEKVEINVSTPSTVTPEVSSLLYRPCLLSFIDSSNFLLLP